MRTLGIDLAAQAEKTAYCVIDWTGDGVEVGVPVLGASDDTLLEMMASLEWTGIDAPWGWPSAFIDAVQGWATGGRWPPGGSGTMMRHRETDRVVNEVVGETVSTKLWPLSVSSDRIAVCAWRCAQLLTAHTERTGWRLDRVGVPDGERRRGDVMADRGVVEVYPAAALALWALPAKGYKGAAASATVQRAVRTEIVAGLEAKADWLVIDDDVREACVADDDRLDALIASLVARAAATGRTLPPNRLQLEAARREGWIHLPDADAIFDLA
jgi:predicted nuclease with RNAse H fold